MARPISHQYLWCIFPEEKDLCEFCQCLGLWVTSKLDYNSDFDSTVSLKLLKHRECGQGA